MCPLSSFGYVRYEGAAQAGSGSVAVRNLTEPTGFFKPINFTANRESHNKQSHTQQVSVQQNETKTELPLEVLSSSGSNKNVIYPWQT